MFAQYIGALTTETNSLAARYIQDVAKNTLPNQTKQNMWR